MTQEEALEVMKTGVNIFLTGAPGTGKTYTINAYIKWLREHGVEPSVTASTGIAATHINGRTIHSFIGIGVVDHLDDYVIDMIMQREATYKRIVNAKVLIIDEISMLDSKVLDKINVILKGVRNSSKAFGGLQVIFVGDFFQLPPVSDFGAKKKFAYEALAWREAKPLTCYLETQYRQSEEILLDLLLAMRNRDLGDSHIDLLNERISISKNIDEESDLTRLYTHNLNVDKLNDSKLEKINSEEFVYEMRTFGSKARIESLQKSCLAPEFLKLKVGAKVMFIKNDLEGEFVNGTVGTVFSLTQDKIKVRLLNGKLIEVKQADWSIEEDGKVKARLVQYPLRLAWAITVHKSQGMSLDEAVISLGQTFEYGQGYVALSRVRSVSGLHLLDFNQTALEVDLDVYKQDKIFKKDSELIIQKLSKSDKSKLVDLQNEFLLRCGGTLDKTDVVKKEVQMYVADTQFMTKKLFLQGLSVDEIAKERKLKRETVAKHIEELVLDGGLKKADIEKSFEKILPIPNPVKVAFGNLGFEKLTPVYKALEEKYSFDYLRIYRILLRFDS